MREKQKKEIRKNSLRKSNGITLIALVVTIVVLLILAGVSISMLTGDSGIISQAKNAKEQNEIGKEKEYINLAFTAVKGNKIANGDISAVTSTELQGEINKYTNEATVTGSGILKITYTSGREYEVDGSGRIINGESYDGMYNVEGLEGKIAPEDLFEYEIIDEQNKTARILRIKAEYCNIDGYNFTTKGFCSTDTNGDIIYKGEQISDILVIPYEVTINGGKYTITEANVGVASRQFYYSVKLYYMSLPNVKWIVYPNTIEKIEYYVSNENDEIMYRPDNNRYSTVENITFSDNIKAITGETLNNTLWYENQPDGEIYIGRAYYMYKGEITENTSIIIKEGTRYIIENAFSGYSDLSNITIPDSIIYIGDGAFNGTKWYENQPDGDLYIGKVYYGYKGEMPENTNIAIKEGTTQIANSAFQNYTTLTSITIPESVTSIEDYAFYNCSSLTSITIPDGVTSIEDYAFYNCSSLTSIIIPDGVTSIGYCAFYECYNLSNITIPDGVTSIGTGAFCYCSSLTNITIPNSVTSIGVGAFNVTKWYENQPDGDLYIGTIYYGYKGEMPENTSITIRNGTIKITERAFYYCSGLTNITIPNSVTSIEDYAFYNCSSLTSITIPDSVTSIGAGAFNNCSSLTTITIPNSVTSIGDHAFEDCSSLTSITIPNSVTTIGDHAFDDCSSLTTITILEGLVSIGYSAFYECTNLTSITIPESVTSIEYYAFFNCSSLRTVNYTGTEEQWNKLYINILYENYNLKNATVNYNYTGE